MTTLKRFFHFFLALTFISCHFAFAQDEIKSSSTIDGDGAMLFKFEMDQSLGILQHVKFVIYLDAAKQPAKIIFQNTQTFPFHSDFLTTTKEFAGKSRAQIDDLTLKDGPDRKALLGTVFVHLQNGQDKDNIITNSFELVTNEVVPVKAVKTIQEMILKSSPGTLQSSTFAYLASGKNKKAILDQAVDLKSVGVKIYDVFKNKNYQAYVQGWNVGQVKVVHAAQLDEVMKSGQINAETILIVDQVPREIPPLKGLISVEPTASSSHVALLAEMFKIPFASDRKIMEHAEKLDGQKVYLNIGPSKVTRLISIDEQTYQRLLKIKTVKPLEITVDYSKIQIAQTQSLKDTDISAYGGKAVRLGLLKRQIPENAPEYSLGIPVSFFKRYLETVTLEGQQLKEVINSHLKAIATGDLNYAEITAHLSQIRATMKSTPVPGNIVQEIHAQIGKFIPATVSRIKLRSSSNVEDGSEFNGAGLYDSEGVWLNNAPADKKDDFAKGLNKVWRSFYSDRGFLARQAFKVDETKAAMGILVQETFVGELANGVALWHPPQNEWSEDTVKVIGFPGEETSVTNPTTPDQPEIVTLNGIIDSSQEPPVIDWNSNIDQRTNLLPIGQSIMPEDLYKQLAALMLKVARNWPGEKPASGLDFEWKLIERNNQRQLLLKQVRPLVKEQVDQLPEGSNFFIVGGFEEELEISYPESNAAFAQHFCPEKVKVTLPSFTDSEIKNSLMIPSVKISFYGKDYEFKNVAAEGTTAVNDGRPEFSVNFNVDTDVYKGLRFSFLSPYSSESGKVIDIYRAIVRGSVKDVATAKAFFPAVENYHCTLSSAFDYGMANQLDPEIAVARMNAVIKAKDGSIAIKGEYKLQTGFDKTLHYTLKETMVSGFGLKSPAKITTPQASVYTGGHHNFFWGVSIDMNALEIPEADKQALIKKFGRYFMYSSSSVDKKDLTAAWLSSDGKQGKPFKATWEVKH